MGERGGQCGSSHSSVAQGIDQSDRKDAWTIQVRHFLLPSLLIRCIDVDDDDDVDLRICIGFFTSLPSAVQLCLNGEPIISLQPDLADAISTNSQSLKEEKYTLRRMRHSIGEVTCLCVDEHISLPTDAILSIRFHSSASAQAFFSIKKL